jgi:hypothetical protein
MPWTDAIGRPVRPEATYHRVDILKRGFDDVVRRFHCVFSLFVRDGITGLSQPELRKRASQLQRLKFRMS